MPVSHATLSNAVAALAAADIEEKLAAVELLGVALAAGADSFAVPPAPTFPAVPPRGVPVRPQVIAARDVPSRAPNTPAGRAALVHAIAHIEYSAIDLALDHALRFPAMPAPYHAEWLGVAVEEAEHFRLLRGHLRGLGHDYGDFPVHDSLWRMAERTAHDVLVRMALVPRLLEARGLDATPPIQRKLAAAGDAAAVRILDRILADEVGHVGLGDRWFRVLCAARGLNPEAAFRNLIVEFGAPWPVAPMNREARRRAGFGDAELEALAKGPAA